VKYKQHVKQVFAVFKRLMREQESGGDFTTQFTGNGHGNKPQSLIDKFMKFPLNISCGASRMESSACGVKSRRQDLTMISAKVHAVVKFPSAR